MEVSKNIRPNTQPAVGTSNSGHSSDPAFLSVGRGLAKALYSDLKALKQNFMALFGFGRLIAQAFPSIKGVIGKNDPIMVTRHTRSAEVIAHELKQLMSDMKTLDQSMPAHEQSNHHKRVTDMLSEIKDTAEKKMGTLTSNTTTSAPLPEKVRPDINNLKALIDKIDNLNEENMISEGEKIIARYAKKPQEMTIQAAIEVFPSIDLSLNLDLLVHTLEKDKQSMLEAHQNSANAWMQAVTQEEKSSEYYGHGFRALLADQEEPRTKVANKMVNVLGEAAEGNIKLEQYLTPEETRYLNQSIGAAKEPSFLWQGVEKKPLAQSEMAGAYRKGHYETNSLNVHKQFAAHMATWLRPNHQRSILDRLEQAHRHLAAGPRGDIEIAWSKLNHIDDHAVLHFFQSNEDQSALRNVFHDLKQAMRSHSSSKSSPLLKAIHEKLNKLEQMLGIDVGSARITTNTHSEIQEVPESSTHTQENRKTWFFHDFDFKGLNAAFFEERFRENMSFSPNHPEQFLEHLEHAQHEISSIKITLENLPPPERAKLGSMMEGLSDHIQNQMDLMRQPEVTHVIKPQHFDQLRQIKDSLQGFAHLFKKNDMAFIELAPESPRQ